jgi:predicted dehydrogenase
MKLAMLGMWHTHADGIVRQIARHPGEFALVAFYDRDPTVVAHREESWKDLIPGFRVFGSPKDLLAQPLDGVIVEGRVYQNLDLARMALEAGKPVMLEKPAGDDMVAFRGLVELARRKHLHLQMIYLFRYMSAVQKLLSLSRRGDLGKIYEFRARLPKDLPSYEAYVRDLDRYPGGIFFEMAGHVVDIMIAILGKPRTIVPFLAHHHESAGSFVDNGVAVFGFDRAWGIIEVPALEVAPHSRRTEVYGTKGAFVIPHLGSGHLPNKDIQPVEIFKVGEPDWQRIDLPARTLQISDLREFAAVAAGKKPPDFDLEHDLTVQECLLEASKPRRK